MLVVAELVTLERGGQGPFWLGHGWVFSGSNVINKSSDAEFLTVEPSINGRASICIFYCNWAVAPTGKCTDSVIISTMTQFPSFCFYWHQLGAFLCLHVLCLVYNGKSGGGCKTRCLISRIDQHSSIHPSENTIEAIRGQSLWVNMVTSAVRNLTGAALCQGWKGMCLNDYTTYTLGYTLKGHFMLLYKQFLI